MFAYCLNNPVVLVDTSGTAAHIGFSADGQLHDSPWKIGSPGGGGWSQDIHYSQQDYGSVAEKFYTVRAAKFVGNRIAHSAHKLWDSYVYSVERSSDLCLQRNEAHLKVYQYIFSKPRRTIEFTEVFADSISGSVGVAAALTVVEFTNPTWAFAAATVNAVRALYHLYLYFHDIDTN